VGDVVGLADGRCVGVRNSFPPPPPFFLPLFLLSFSLPVYKGRQGVRIISTGGWVLLAFWDKGFFWFA